MLYCDPGFTREKDRGYSSLIQPLEEAFLWPILELDTYFLDLGNVWTIWEI